MSKMFENLRRAELERRRKNSGRAANDAPEVTEPVAVPGVRGEAAAEPSRNGSGDMPVDLVRELGILRNSLQSALRDRPRRTLLFTSASHEEGVTTLATSYARLEAAGSNQRVLLIELNARRPALFWRLGLSDEDGVSNYFAERRSLSSLVQRDPRFGFDVIHVGEKDPESIQLHVEKDLPRMLEEASAVYDTVVIDAPPVSMSPETPQIAAHVDGVVLVVYCGRTKREIVQRSVQMLEQFDGRVLGIVLNRKKYYIPKFLYERL